MIWFPDIANMPPLSKYGAPKLTVPRNGEPSLIEIVNVATMAPSGVVSRIVGAAGVIEITGTGGAAPVAPVAPVVPVVPVAPVPPVPPVAPVVTVMFALVAATVKLLLGKNLTS